MTAYINNVYKQLPKDNEGHKYITSETIYVPVLKAKLSVTTRKTQNLRIVDETILKFIDAGVITSNDISGYMGISPEILDISLAELFSQDYITVTSRTCHMEDKGRAYLKGEKSSLREIEEMRDIYVNLCTGDLLFNSDNYVNNIYANSYKCAHEIIGDLKFFRQNIGKLKEEYDTRQIDMQRGYVSGRKIVSDVVTELLNINSVLDSTVLFKVLKLNFYVSDSHDSIDIISVDSSNTKLVETLKPYLLNEIKNQRVLKSFISNLNEPKLIQEKPVSSEDAVKLLSAIKNYYTEKDKQTAEELIIEHVYTSRSLLENEMVPLVELLSKRAKKADIYIGGYLNREYQNPEISTAVQYIAGVKSVRIFYNNDFNIEKALYSITRSNPSIKNENIIKEQFGDDIKIVFDDIYTISGKLYQMPVYDKLFLKYRKYTLNVDNSKHLAMTKSESTDEETTSVSVAEEINNADGLHNVRDIHICFGEVHCYHKQHIIDEKKASILCVNNKGVVSSVPIYVNFCPLCDKCFLQYNIFKMYQEKYKNLLIKFIPTDTGLYSDDIKGSYLSFDLREESLLHVLGYNTKLTTTTRRMRLITILSCGQMRKNEILKHLDYLVRFNKNNPKHSRSIQTWNDDLEFLADYKLDEHDEIYGQIVMRTKSFRST